MPTEQDNSLSNPSVNMINVAKINIPPINQHSIILCNKCVFISRVSTLSTLINHITTLNIVFISVIWYFMSLG